MGDFFSKPQLHDLDLYQEVYRPMGYKDHCLMHVRTDPGSTVFVGVFRDDGVFSEADKGTLELLQPHLANARRLAFAATEASGLPLHPEVFAGLGFTPRESDVLSWLVVGKSNDEIASILRIRADSVSRNLQAISTKMGVDHRVSATLHALTLARRVHAAAISAQGGAVHLGVTTRKKSPVD